MFRSLLLGVDASASAGVAASLAVDLARRLGAHLLVAWVDEHDESPSLMACLDAQPVGFAPAAIKTAASGREQGEKRLRWIAREAAEAGVACETQWLSGRAVEALLAAAHDADLVILGRQGVAEERDHAGRPGASLTALLHRSELPVLVAGIEHEPLERILLGVDGGRAMEHVLVNACELAVALNVPLAACAVDDDTGRARHRLDDVAHFGERHGLVIDTQVAGGQPAETLTGLTQEGDLLALGAFGEGAFHEWWRGSTTADVLTRSSRALLLHR